jgi:autotransporter-associated beta strand protein
MKPCLRRIPPQAFVLCVAPILTFSSAFADVINFNQANATNVWTLPAGTNLLNGATAIPATANTHEGSSSSWATVTDGILGVPGDNAATVTPNNGDSVVFPLDIVAQPAGYDITSFDAYVTWLNSGRSNQDFVLQYSTVEEPEIFNDIATVANHDSGSNNSTHTSLTDTTGVLASGVHSVKIIFNNQENGYVGFSELKLLATPTNVETLVESNVGNAWTLPAGANLLKGINAQPATTNTNEGSSADWTTVTDGALGAAADISSSVTPPDNSSVIFPLDTSANFNGYNLTSFDSYCSWPNSGRDNQDIAISYSVVGAEETFIPLGYAVAHTGADNATHVRLTPVSGFLATGVAAIKLDFGHQESGFVGYREFIALGSAVPLSDPLTWTGASGSPSNATWITGTDNNWKKTIGGAPATYNQLAPLTFDSSTDNRNISVPTALSSSSMAFINAVADPFTFSGQLVTVSNDIRSSGTGSATFGNPLHAGTGVALTGPGSLVFNGALAGSGVTVSGSGGVTLNASNPGLTGNASVSGGTLTVSHDEGLLSGNLVATGGSVRFTSATPKVASISGTSDGAIVLGKTSGPLVNTNLSVGNAASLTTFAGSLSQAASTTGRLTKTGGSTLVLSGVNTYTGPTSVTGGVLLR